MARAIPKGPNWHGAPGCSAKGRPGVLCSTAGSGWGGGCALLPALRGGNENDDVVFTGIAMPPLLLVSRKIVLSDQGSCEFRIERLGLLFRRLLHGESKIVAFRI